MIEEHLGQGALPQAGDDTAGSGDIEGALQAGQSFPTGDCSQTRLAGGQNNQIDRSVGGTFRLF